MSRSINIDDYFEGNNLSSQPKLINKDIKVELKFYKGCCYKFIIGILFFY